MQSQRQSNFATQPSNVELARPGSGVTGPHSASVAWYYKAVDSFYVQNFGCRATQADGAAIERQLEDQGFDRAVDIGKASVVVFNTCTVTAAADQDARSAIRRVHRENPKARIVVTGCYAQRAPEELAGLPGVTHVVGNSHKHQLAEVASLLPQRTNVHPASNFVPLGQLGSPLPAEIVVSDIFAHTELLAAPVFEAANERTRPNLKVQDGCDNRCSFCVIPFVRGQSRSLTPDRIVREVETMVQAGFREVVISGINLGRWGRDLVSSTAKLRFEDLVRLILDETSLEKLRISSVEPMDWSDELIEMVASSPRIAKHAHAPMQSGSDAVLRRMHRKYRPWHYRERMEKIRSAMPLAAIGADVMVGFPGETDQEFEETRRMVEELPFTYLHVFTYSARPGTPAARMGKQVSSRVAHERNRVLRDLADEKKGAFLRAHIGREVQAITLHSKSGFDASHRNVGRSMIRALTDNYLSLVGEGHVEANRWITTRVERVVDGDLVGGRVENLVESDSQVLA